MIKVLSSGFYSSIQDLGRVGFAHIGVPVSGAMDGYSARLANQLLRNNNDAAVLEITYGNCKLEFQVDQVVCIAGGDFSAQVNGVNILLNTPVQVSKGAILSFGKQIYGVRTYVAVQGGFTTDVILNSRSFYNGITKEKTIVKGMLLPVHNVATPLVETESTVKINTEHFTANNMCCYKGPEYDLLTRHQQQLLEQMQFTISNDISRMGYKLEEVIENQLQSMLTSAVLPGTVQLTPSGKLIVLMRDCQVTGGYPRVLQLSEKAINQLAQKTTRDTFSFDLITA